MCLLCFHVHLFFAALWSPAGKGLSSWLAFVMSYCEACKGVIGIQDIGHFTSRDIGYYPFYFQGYRILCSISGILCFLLKRRKNRKRTVKVPLKDESLKRKRLSLNEMYEWFLLAYLTYFFNPTRNIKMVFGEKIPKMGTFSDFCHYFLC